jgi:enamine deaminase RidA (YjgF/YER057c/UK114 family)
VPVTRSGNLLFLSGHVPFKEDMKTLHVGKVGKDYSTEEGAKFAERIGLELISTLKATVGDLDRVKKIVKLVGFVNCVDDYTEQPEVRPSFSAPKPCLLWRRPPYNQHAHTCACTCMYMPMDMHNMDLCMYMCTSFVHVVRAP